MKSARKVIEKLACLDPRVAALLVEHDRDNHETLPHVFMGDVARFAGVLARNGRADFGALDALLAEIELAVTSGIADVEELVVVSFLENLHQTGDAYEAVVQRLGPECRRALVVVERDR